MRLLTNSAVQILLIVVGAIVSHAASTTYSMHFSGGSSNPTSGSFTYDATASAFTSFTVTWDGVTFNLLPSANGPVTQNYASLQSECPGLLNGVNAALMFAILTGSAQCNGFPLVMSWAVYPPNPPGNVFSSGFNIQLFNSSDAGFIFGGLDPDTSFIATPTSGTFTVSTALPSSQVAVTASGLVYSRVTQTFNGSLTIKNIGGATISGPLQIDFTGLPGGVSLLNATGSLSGSPYITVAVSPGGQITWTLENVKFANGETASGTLVVDSFPMSGFYTVEAWNLKFGGLPNGYPTSSSGIHNPLACSTTGCAFICSATSDGGCFAQTGYYQTSPVQDAVLAGASTSALGSGKGMAVGMELLANQLFPPTAGLAIPFILTTPSVQESYVYAYNFDTGQYADVGNLVTGSVVQTVAPTITDKGLAPGQSVTVPLQFKNLSSTPISFKPIVYLGSFN